MSLVSMFLCISIFFFVSVLLSPLSLLPLLSLLPPLFSSNHHSHPLSLYPSRDSLHASRSLPAYPHSSHLHISLDLTLADSLPNRNFPTLSFLLLSQPPNNRTPKLLRARTTLPHRSTFRTFLWADDFHINVPIGDIINPINISLWMWPKTAHVHTCHLVIHERRKSWWRILAVQWKWWTKWGATIWITAVLITTMAFFTAWLVWKITRRILARAYGVVVENRNGKG